MPGQPFLLVLPPRVFGLAFLFDRSPLGLDGLRLFFMFVLCLVERRLHPHDGLRAPDRGEPAITRPVPFEGPSKCSDQLRPPGGQPAGTRSHSTAWSAAQILAIVT